MASGRVEAAGSTHEPAELAGALTEADFVTLLAPPAGEHVLAAATIASASLTPNQLRVLKADTAPPNAPGDVVLSTAPELADADYSLPIGSPLEAACDVAESLPGEGLPSAELLLDPPTARRPGPALIAPSVAQSLAASTALHGEITTMDAEAIARRLDDLGVPTDATALLADEAAGRRLASWLAADACATPEAPTTAVAGMEQAVRVTPLEDHPIPTLEGLRQVLAVGAAAAPGALVSTLLTEESWSEYLPHHEAAAERIHELTDSLPTDRTGPLVLAEREAGPIEPAAWLWTAFRLPHPYGAVLAGSDPAQLAFASTGSRAASAVLEAVTTTHGGVCWGDEHLAGARIDAPDGLEATLTSEL